MCGCTGAKKNSSLLLLLLLLFPSEKPKKTQRGPRHITVPPTLSLSCWATVETVKRFDTAQVKMPRDYLSPVISQPIINPSCVSDERTDFWTSIRFSFLFFFLRACARFPSINRFFGSVWAYRTTTPSDPLASALKLRCKYHSRKTVEYDYL